MTPEDQKELRQLSDEKKYSIKHRRLAYLISQREHEWDAEPDGEGNMLAVTHRPTKFRIHIPDDIPGLPEKFRRIAKRKRNAQIAGGVNATSSARQNTQEDSLRAEEKVSAVKSALQSSGSLGTNLSLSPATLQPPQSLNSSSNIPPARPSGQSSLSASQKRNAPFAGKGPRPLAVYGPAYLDKTEQNRIAEEKRQLSQVPSSVANSDNPSIRGGVIGSGKHRGFIYSELDNDGKPAIIARDSNGRVIGYAGRPNIPERENFKHLSPLPPEYRQKAIEREQQYAQLKQQYGADQAAKIMYFGNAANSLAAPYAAAGIAGLAAQKTLNPPTQQLSAGMGSNSAPQLPKNNSAPETNTAGNEDNLRSENSQTVAPSDAAVQQNNSETPSYITRYQNVNTIFSNLDQNAKQAMIEFFDSLPDAERSKLLDKLNSFSFSTSLIVNHLNGREKNDAFSVLQQIFV